MRGRWKNGCGSGAILRRECGVSKAACTLKEGAGCFLNGQNKTVADTPPIHDKDTKQAKSSLHRQICTVQAAFICRIVLK